MTSRSKKPLRMTENQTCALLAKLVRAEGWQVPGSGVLAFKVFNEGERAGARVMLGLLPGVADWVFVSRGRVWFVELKGSGATCKQSPLQARFEVMAEQAGAPYYLARDAYDALRWVKAQLKEAVNATN